MTLRIVILLLVTQASAFEFTGKVMRNSCERPVFIILASIRTILWRTGEGLDLGLGWASCDKIMFDLLMFEKHCR